MTWKPAWMRSARHAAKPRTPSTSISGGAATRTQAPTPNLSGSDDPLLRLYDAERRKIRLRLGAAFIGLGLVVGGLATGFYVARSTAETATVQRDVAAGERDVAATSADQLAGKVLTECAATTSDPDAGPDAATCAQARAVQTNPVVAAARDGAPGVGVRSTEIRPDGHLLVTYEDGRQVDAGLVVGPAGLGLAAVVITDGRLIITFSDGRVQDLGPVVGDRGRSVESVGQLDGRLVITYDDGTTQDAGPLPVPEPGRQGDPGRDGPACPPGFTPIETGPATGADGTSYGRSITCVDPQSAMPAPEEDGGP